MTMTTIMTMTEARRRMTVATGDHAVVEGNFAPRYHQANLLEWYLVHLVASPIVDLSFLRFLGSAGDTTWARTLAHVPLLPWNQIPVRAAVYNVFYLGWRLRDLANPTRPHRAHQAWWQAGWDGCWAAAGFAFQRKVRFFRFDRLLYHRIIL